MIAEDRLSPSCIPYLLQQQFVFVLVLLPPLLLLLLQSTQPSGSLLGSVR